MKKKNDKEIYLYHLIEKRQIRMGLYKERRWGRQRKSRVVFLVIVVNLLQPGQMMGNNSISFFPCAYIPRVFSPRLSIHYIRRLHIYSLSGRALLWSFPLYQKMGMEWQIPPPFFFFNPPAQCSSIPYTLQVMTLSFPSIIRGLYNGNTCVQESRGNAQYLY